MDFENRFHEAQQSVCSGTRPDVVVLASLRSLARREWNRKEAAAAITGALTMYPGGDAVRESVYAFTAVSLLLFVNGDLNVKEACDGLVAMARKLQEEQKAKHASEAGSSSPGPRPADHHDG